MIERDKMLFEYKYNFRFIKNTLELIASLTEFMWLSTKLIN